MDRLARQDLVGQEIHIPGPFVPEVQRLLIRRADAEDLLSVNDDPLPLIPQQFSLVGLIGGPFEAEGRFGRR